MALEFGPARRLRKHGEFSRAQRSGRRVSTAHFVLLVALQPQARPETRPPRATSGATSGATGGGGQPSRLGVVVARKVGDAVRRNRVKRLCRECFRSWPDLLPGGVDLIAIARAGADELGLAEVQAEWRAVERQLRRRAAEALARGPGPDHPPPPDRL